MNSVGPGKRCRAEYSIVGTGRSSCRSSESMAKLLADWNYKIEERSSAEDKCEHLGRRTTRGSIFKVCDNRSCFVIMSAVLRRSYRLLLQFEIVFLYRASSRFQLLLRGFPCVLWDRA
jgi:hypothetical protein